MTTKMKSVSATPLLVDRRELARLLSVSTATLDRMSAAGKIGPKPIKLSAGRLAWRLATIERWLIESEAYGELIDRKDWIELTTINAKV